MKKVKKGFTLIELLLVIAIMGILSVMGMIAGQEATSAARATVIADHLEKLKTAGEMFYSENSEDIDKYGKLGGKNGTAITVTQLAAGINNYLDDDNAVATAAADNQYFVAVNGTATELNQTWWIGYQFATSDENERIQKAMVNKVHRMGLTSDTASAGDTGPAYTATDATVYLKIR